MISNKKFEFGKIYSICVTIGFDLNEGLADMSLYIDGIMALKYLFLGHLSKAMKIIIGKYDSSCHGFIGTIS